MNLFTPKKIDGHFVFRVSTEKCSQCKKEMIEKPGSSNRTFPMYFKDNLEAQASRAGIAIKARSKYNGASVCRECVDSGSLVFRCCLCYETKKTNEIQESFGDSEEHLCMSCYETVPAKVWADKVDDLNEEHMWG